MTLPQDTLLMHLPASLYRRGDVLLLDDQACNGLRLWAEHFGRLIVLVAVEDGAAPGSWVPLEHIGPSASRIEFVHLPSAWRPDRFLRALGPTRKRIRHALAQADFIGTTLGGASFGDWGAVIAREAVKLGLPFYIWTDRVEPDVARRLVKTAPLRRKLRLAVEYPIMQRMEQGLIAKAALGLFHGRETYDAYAPHSPNPQHVHDIHIRKLDHITADALAQKQARQGTLRIVYAGRADPMKGTGDWLSVLEQLTQAGVDFHAEWLGDGPDLTAMRARVEAGPLKGRVALPGFVADRGRLLEALRDADVLMFCHLTPESPRVLIEALASGCPLLGYDSAYPADLIAGHGGGVLTPLGQPQHLATALAALARDRARLAALIGRAAQDGAQFDDETVFAHRAGLIRQHLPRARPVA
ncbi:glycosyltransferase [Roseibaca sp. Y0-43]|uniref:glycosyltransferase n=1 Tax=Roseibaca sp. Y0-43 TaxID=2816854 RepID=UPI001D0C299B|nr:glycosyltransferase [Roseibaca sp. Y0-43]MCC1480473.1 glycosyltransferase [Roseibaca sp. Y0-43]